MQDRQKLLANYSSFRTTYAFSSLDYFFSVSQIIDFQIGRFQKLSLQSILSNLQQSNFTLPNVLALFSFLFNEQKPPLSQDSIEIVPSQQAKFSKTLKISSENIKLVLQNDGFKVVYSLITFMIKKLQNSDSATIDDEIVFKSIINTFYVLIYWIQKDNLSEAIKNKSNSQQILAGSPYLNHFYKDVDIDSLLIKLFTLSLEYHFIPIKKISMLYTKVLANLFSFQSSNGKGNIFIHPVTIFDDEAIQQLPTQNTLDQNYLQKLKQKLPPLTQMQRNPHFEPIQEFYRKNNIGDCPLAQSIVVGLLRSLLTICNSQNHKKFSTVKGAGVDSFRQWQLSYRYAIQNWTLTEKSCSLQTIQRIKNYQEFDRTANQKGDPAKASSIFHEFYMHKIYTTSVVTNFFMIILLGLKLNIFIQYSYFLQLISDANGILVFLKFLTDKFQYLEEINDHQLNFLDDGQSDKHEEVLLFKDKVMLTVYSILNMLHSSCNNYPQKVKNYLFEYNSYLIIKKIPLLFFPALKTTLTKQISASTQTKKKDDLQGSLPNLPSKQDIQELINNKKSVQEGSKLTEQAPLIIRRLTQTCYDLLKIQIPYFSKKMKDTNNMKMLIDIYCRFPKTVEPIKRTTLQKIQLKCKNKKNMMNMQQNKPITSVEEMKNMHNEYNNLYYWSNDFVNQLQGGRAGEKDQKSDKRQKSSLKQLKEKQTKNEVDADFDYEEWLEENLWRYYD